MRLRSAILIGAIFSAGTCLAEETTSHSFTVDGVKIHYQTFGTGSPVVLIHGLAATADLNWKLPGILAELAKNHQVIAIDMPGHGKSDAPEKASAYGKQIPEDVVALLDHLKIEQAHIVGYSLGGMVTMRLMADHPDRVLSGTVGGMGWLKEGSPLQKFWEGLANRIGAKTSAAFLRGVPELALTEDEVKNIAVPVKVIVGDRDPCRPMYVVPLQKIRPEWPVTEIEAAGHLNCVIKPQFKEEIAAWINQNDK